ncbi:MAG TPA: HypC/HybG/HupF family hydrogenase formation chaperone [Roseiflexaceae bacterium]|nr:HypC/HybG/HupF family hydrogenase formation chaperone [Roseiflexaceae bacterium]
MTDERHIARDQGPTQEANVGASTLVVGQTCATCADEARPAKVLSVDDAAGLAFVTIGDTNGEVDISLIDDVEPGVVLLIHGGVAIGKL